MTVIPDSFRDRIYLVQDEAARQPLYLAMGKAITTWASVERALLEIFRHLTGLSSAAHLFHSQSSFDAKLRLVKAAVTGSKATDHQKKYLALVLGIAENYSRTRNQIVHRIPVVIVRGGTTVAALSEGSDFGPLKATIADALTPAKIEVAEENFYRLSWLLQEAVRPETLAEPALLLPRLALLAEQLPSVAHANQLSQRQQGLLRQQRAAAKAPVPKKNRREAR